MPRGLWNWILRLITWRRRNKSARSLAGRVCSAAVVLLVLLTGIYSSCAGNRSAVDAGDQPVQLSPHLSLFLEQGFELADDTLITEAFRVAIDGQDYIVLEYRTPKMNGLQIKRHHGFVTDPDLAFLILLSYAWAPEHHGMSTAEIDSLRQLQQRIGNAEQEYHRFFELARALTPVVEKVDELKDKQITGIPVISIGSFDLIDIANWWDLICTIPFDIFDLCLLEPLVREIHEQGVEIEELLRASNNDLSQTIRLLETQAAGQAVDGLALKESMEKSFSSLNNLVWKLNRFKENVLGLQVLNDAMIDVLENERWGSKTGKVISFLDSNILGFSSEALTGGLLSRLDSLDRKMTAYLEKADEMIAEIDQRAVRLLAARARTDAELADLGAQWRARPGK